VKRDLQTFALPASSAKSRSRSGQHYLLPVQRDLDRTGRALRQDAWSSERASPCAGVVILGNKPSGFSVPNLRHALRWEPQPESVLKFLRERANVDLKTLNDSLAQSEFLVPSGLTIADLSCAGYLYWIDQAGSHLWNFPTFNTGSDPSQQSMVGSLLPRPCNHNETQPLGGGDCHGVRPLSSPHLERMQQANTDR